MTEDENVFEESKNLSEERIKELSNKVKLTAKERDELAEAKKQAEDKVQSLEKERDFFSGFADITFNHPGAKDHKDEIREKYMKGYSLEDAAVAVLAKAGKFEAPRQVEAPIAGGSAATTMPSKGQKSPSEMSQEERRSALLEAEQRGDLSVS